MARLRNVYACLVHERFDCVADLVRNLRYFDADSPILLYNGGGDATLLQSSFPLDSCGAIVHPQPQRAEWGRLHGFALDCMWFALQNLPFDTLTIVDSDQLAARRGYVERLETCLAGHPKAGILGNGTFVQTPGSAAPPARDALREIDLWRPFLQQFANGEDKFVRWCFWPSTVFTADAARELTRLFAHDCQLHRIMSRTQIWASEEVILPTLVSLAGFDTVTSPCSYDLVRYRTSYSEGQLLTALDDPDVFWIHPVPRQYDNPLRTLLRERHHHYCTSAPKRPRRPAHQPRLTTALHVPPAVHTTTGWLDDDESVLLLAAADRALEEHGAHAIVEVGSYCGRGTIVLGHAVRARQSTARVYAVDPHDGVVGALDRGTQNAGPTFARFQQNIAEAALAHIVEPLQQRASALEWNRPIGLLVIDGLHDYINVASDFHRFAPSLQPGGYVAFHDYADYYPGVKAFVDELLAGGEYRLVDQARSLVVLRRSAGLSDVILGAPEPLVSCVMATADRADFVPQAIEYFFRQDYPNRELIIVDDGAESIAPFVPGDPRIRYVRLEDRRTMGAKHNLACELARGDVICHWDDDDWNADWRLSYQVEQLLQTPTMTLSGLSNLLYYEPKTGRAAQYIYPPNSGRWVSGNTLCYRKAFWQSHRFPDMNEGADTIFVWSLTDAHVQALEDNSFFVAIVHPGNTSPKRMHGFGWHDCDGGRVTALLSADAGFYERWRQ